MTSNHKTNHHHNNRGTPQRPPGYLKVYATNQDLYLRLACVKSDIDELHKNSRDRKLVEIDGHYESIKMFFKNPKRQPIDEVMFFIEGMDQIGDYIMKIPAISEYWIRDSKWRGLSYNPLMASADLEKLKEDLRWLADQPYHVFWSNVFCNPSIPQTIFNFINEEFPKVTHKSNELPKNEQKIYSKLMDALKISDDSVKKRVPTRNIALNQFLESNLTNHSDSKSERKLGDGILTREDFTVNDLELNDERINLYREVYDEIFYVIQRIFAPNINEMIYISNETYASFLNQYLCETHGMEDFILNLCFAYDNDKHISHIKSIFTAIVHYCPDTFSNALVNLAYYLESLGVILKQYLALLHQKYPENNASNEYFAFACADLRTYLSLYDHIYVFYRLMDIFPVFSTVVSMLELEKRIINLLSTNLIATRTFLTDMSIMNLNDFTNKWNSSFHFTLMLFRQFVVGEIGAIKIDRTVYNFGIFFSQTDENEQHLRKYLSILDAIFQFETYRVNYSLMFDVERDHQKIFETIEKIDNTFASKLNDFTEQSKVILSLQKGQSDFVKEKTKIFEPSDLKAIILSSVNRLESRRVLTETHGEINVDTYLSLYHLDKCLEIVDCMNETNDTRFAAIANGTLDLVDVDVDKNSNEPSRSYIDSNLLMRGIKSENASNTVKITAQLVETDQSSIPTLAPELDVIKSKPLYNQHEKFLANYEKFKIIPIVDKISLKTKPLLRELSHVLENSAVKHITLEDIQSNVINKPEIRKLVEENVIKNYAKKFQNDAENMKVSTNVKANTVNGENSLRTNGLRAGSHSDTSDDEDFKKAMEESLRMNRENDQNAKRAIEKVEVKINEGHAKDDKFDQLFKAEMLATLNKGRNNDEDAEMREAIRLSLMHGDNATNGFAPDDDVDKVYLDSLVTEIKDILPDKDDGFIIRCLKHFKYDTQETLSAILENNIPQEIIKPKPAVVSEQFTSLPSTSTENLEELRRIYQAGGAVPRSLAKLIQQQKEQKSIPVIPDDPDDYLTSMKGHERRNVFDGDEFDLMTARNFDPRRVFRKKDKIEYANVNQMLNDKSAVKQMAQHYQKYSYQSDYEDLSDDDEENTENPCGLPFKFEQEPVHRDEIIARHQRNQIEDNPNTPKQRPAKNFASSSSSEDDEPSQKRDQFCEDPAVIRERYERARAHKRAQRGLPAQPPRDVVGKKKGQGQEKDVLISRKKKEANKSTRANHNRRSGADFKRRGGMIPS